MEKLNKIKNKIFLLFWKRKKLFLISFVSLLAIPLLSEAVLGTGLFDLFQAMLEGISEKTGPFYAFFVFLFLGVVISALLLELSTFLLKLAADPTRLEIMESEVVQVGWQFTSSLANTGIIIVLIVIGIATILGRSNYTIKKTLPKLILVALLVNFSLVFVGVIVDIAQISLNTFFSPEVIDTLFHAIFRSLSHVFSQLSIFGLSALVGLAIPFTAPVVQIALVTGFLTAALIPQMIEAIMQIIASFLVSGVLFTYAFLFLARIFVIQILAILSPLAFVAWVLPKTQNLWKKWLNALVEWSFLGAVLAFFLLLSSIATEPLRESAMEGGQIPWVGISSIFIYYLTLIVFLAVTVYMAKKFMPQGASAIINQVKEVGNTAMKYGAPIARPAVNKFKAKSWDKATTDNIKKLEEKASSEQGTVFDQANLRFNKAKRWTARLTGTSADKKAEKAKSYKREMYQDLSEKETESLLRSKNIPEYRKVQAIKDYHKRDGDLSESMKQEIANLREGGHIDKKTMKDLKKKNPDLSYYQHNINGKRAALEGAEEKVSKISDKDGKEYKEAEAGRDKKQKALEEAEKKVKDDLSKMTSGNAKEVDFENINQEFAKEIACHMANNPAILASIRDADNKTKEVFVDNLAKGLESLNKSDNPEDKETANKIKKKINDHLSVPRNIERWGGLLDELSVNISADDLPDGLTIKNIQNPEEVIKDKDFEKMNLLDNANREVKMEFAKNISALRDQSKELHKELKEKLESYIEKSEDEVKEKWSLVLKNTEDEKPPSPETINPQTQRKGGERRGGGRKFKTINNYSSYKSEVERIKKLMNKKKSDLTDNEKKEIEEEIEYLRRKIQEKDNNN